MQDKSVNAFYSNIDNFNQRLTFSTIFLYFKEKNSLTKILDDTKLLNDKKKELSPKAKKHIKENFTWDKIVESYQKIMK